MSESPNYYAIIPANVRYDKTLSPSAKLLYGEITALCNKTGYCWATNAYFAELYDVSNKSVSVWISQLVKAGYINSDIEYKDGTKEIFRRCLRIITWRPDEKVMQPMDEKVKENNTSMNNTLNNTNKPQKQAFGEYSNVHLSDIEHSKLFDEYGEAQTNAIIAKLGNYKEEKGKRYKSDMAAIRLWVLDSGKFKKIERPKVEKCPHCGAVIIDGLCRNGDCPQWVKA